MLLENQKEVELNQNPEADDKTISLKKKPEKILKIERKKSGIYMIKGASWQ